MNWLLLQNSLVVAGLATLLSVGLGFVAALALVGMETRWRRALLLASILALVLPPFLVTNCWLHYMGLAGVWRNWLPLNIYSLGGTVWILMLLTWPITLLAVLSAWRCIEPSQIESDPALGGAALIRWLLWPMARVVAGAAAVLTFVLALNNFAVPAILQVKVFPAELWVKFETNRRLGEALAISWPMVTAPIVLLLCWRRSEVSWPRLEGTAAARAIRRQLGPGWFCASLGLTLMLIALSVALPLWQIIASERTWMELPNLIRAIPGTIWNSFAFAAVTAFLCVGLGLAGWRLPIGPILWVPFLMPGVLLGIAIILVFNRRPFDAFYQSGAVVVLAYVIRYLALGWNGVAHALRTADRDLTDAARLSGASSWALLRHVYWPQIAPQAGAAWYLTYLLCLWDVEALVLIVPPGGETLALRIFNLLHYGHNAQVNAMCLLLLALAVAPLAIWSMAKRAT